MRWATNSWSEEHVFTAPSGDALSCLVDRYKEIKEIILKWVSKLNILLICSVVMSKKRIYLESCFDFIATNDV